MNLILQFLIPLVDFVTVSSDLSYVGRDEEGASADGVALGSDGPGLSPDSTTQLLDGLRPL